MRERPGDIPLLVNYFIDNLKKTYNRQELTVTTKALNWLKQLPLPGNIRELKNLVERTVLDFGKKRTGARRFSGCTCSMRLKKPTRKICRP